MAEVMEYPAELHIAQLGEQVLKTTASPVVAFDAELKRFVVRLKAKMAEAGGIGMAAPQVFCGKQIMIIASRPNQRYPNAPDMAPLVMINPQVKAQSETRIKDWEGCLSVPGIRGMVPRAEWVEVCWQNLEGEFNQQRFEGFVARIFLHEYDHLTGKTWLDSVESNSEIMAESVYLSKVVGG